MDALSRRAGSDATMKINSNKIRGSWLVRFFLIISFTLPALTWGHAFPDHSEPRVGSDLTTPPAQVKIWFDGGLEPLFSSLEVFDSNKKKVDNGDSRVDPTDNKLLMVSLPDLPPGKYE